MRKEQIAAPLAPLNLFYSYVYEDEELRDQFLPLQRQVFLLRDLEKRSAVEVATMLGLTVMTVKSRLHRACVTLRQALQSWNE